MKRMKVFEMGSAALFFACFFACFFKACCIEDAKTPKEMHEEFYSTNFEDKVISVVRTRRLYSYDPVRWENPIPEQDEWIWVNYKWVSMSNLYAIVVINSKVDEWVFKRGTARCPFFYKDMPKIGNFCVYNAKNDTLRPCDDRGLVMDKVVDLEELFNRHKSCPCIFFGDGKKGVSFWRGESDNHKYSGFTTLLWAGRPVEYYTVKKFKTWDDFWSWDGSFGQGTPVDSLRTAPGHLTRE